MDCSVIVPTFNRALTLKKTLEALAEQDLESPAASFEVLVVDDGSTDETSTVVEQLKARFPARLGYFYQPNRRQGAARNLGAKAARGDTLVFLGDDTVPVSSFLAEHLKSQRLENSTTVVIGYTPWCRECRQTRFLRYIGEEGWQFGFSLIRDPGNVPFNFFYTSNLSISREFFLESGGFDEDFQEYGWEDVELSFRLKKLGMNLLYNQKAVAYHHHPTTLFSFVERQRKVGYSAWTFFQKHPELDELLNVSRVPSYTLWQHLKMRFLTQVCGLLEAWDRPDLSDYYPHLMSYYYNLGILDGRKRIQR